MTYLISFPLLFPSSCSGWPIAINQLPATVTNMAFAGHQHDHAAGYNEYSTDDKFAAEHVSDTSIANHAVPNRVREAPPLIKIMSDEERDRCEAALVRRIDIRLMPMVILMYIMNYLDRNNIAAARLAGLQKELKLTSTQYSVSARRERSLPKC